MHTVLERAMNFPNADSPDAQPATPAAIEHDRRLHPRHALQIQIELRDEGADVPMRLETTDLSRGGCYVQLLMPLPVGTRVRVTLWLDSHSLVIHGRVVTRHPQFGNGIKFVEFEGQSEQLLKRYLDAIDT
ncbi:MAG: PilZ domain-containing protein [Terriglobales bacterium]